MVDGGETAFAIAVHGAVHGAVLLVFVSLPSPLLVGLIADGSAGVKHVDFLLVAPCPGLWSLLLSGAVLYGGFSW